MASKRGGGGVVAAVSLTMAVAFVAIALFVLYESVGVACRYAESSSELYASELALELPDTLPHANGMDAVCFAASGEVTKTTTAEVSAGDNVFEHYPVLADLRDQLDADNTGTLRVWTGLGAPLPHEQVLFEVRYVRGASTYVLIINPAKEAFDEMRSRDTVIMLALVVVMLLLLMLVMGIVRWYRKRLIRVATTDELTGLANRRAFASSYEELVEDGTMGEATLALIDVDRFKQINDGFGHASGDLALAAVAAEVREMVGPSGLAGRWGGDEFIGVVRRDPKEATERIEDMVRRVAALEFDEVSDMRVSVSVGSAEVDAGVELQQVVERADDALYVSKEGGRGFLTVYVPGVTPHMTGDKATPVPAQVRPQTIARPMTIAREQEGPNSPQTTTRRARVLDTFVHGLLEAVYRMVPFVAGGGILIALAFLIDGASVNLGSLSAMQRASFGSITPLAGGLKDVGSSAFNFMLPIFAAFFAQQLAGDEAFMAGFAGGYLASQGSSGFLGAIFSALVTALIVRLMRGVINDTAPIVRRVAPVLIYPVFSLLMMYLLMRFVIDPAASAFDAWLTSLLNALEGGSRAVLGGVCGAMMATDLGGPINKAAYHFGTAAIEAGNPDIMASVMVGGMVPPCGIALCMLLFRNRFGEVERDQGAATLFMGLSFITEGAIPFAITDLARVIPACMAGSAVAGTLSEVFGCTLMAPHGGIFVLPVVGSPQLYVVALLAGSLVTAIVLGLLKRAKA